MTPQRKISPHQRKRKDKQLLSKEGRGETTPPKGGGERQHLPKGGGRGPKRKGEASKQHHPKERRQKAAPPKRRKAAPSRKRGETAAPPNEGGGRLDHPNGGGEKTAPPEREEGGKQLPPHFKFYRILNQNKFWTTALCPGLSCRSVSVSQKRKRKDKQHLQAAPLQRRKGGNSITKEAEKGNTTHKKGKATQPQGGRELGKSSTPSKEGREKRSRKQHHPQEREKLRGKGTAAPPDEGGSKRDHPTRGREEEGYDVLLSRFDQRAKQQIYLLNFWIPGGFFWNNCFFSKENV